MEGSKPGEVVREALRGEDGLRSAQLAPGGEITNCLLCSKAEIRLGILETGGTDRRPRKGRVSLVGLCKGLDREGGAPNSPFSGPPGSQARKGCGNLGRQVLSLPLARCLLSLEFV